MNSRSGRELAICSRTNPDGVLMRQSRPGSLLATSRVNRLAVAVGLEASLSSGNGA
jgi:hypothetical protein